MKSQADGLGPNRKSDLVSSLLINVLPIASGTKSKHLTKVTKSLSAASYSHPLSKFPHHPHSSGAPALWFATRALQTPSLFLLPPVACGCSSLRTLLSCPVSQISERKRTTLSQAMDPPTWEQDAVNGTNMRGDFSQQSSWILEERGRIYGKEAKITWMGRGRRATEGSTTVRRCCRNPPTAQSTASTPTS